MNSIRYNCLSGYTDKLERERAWVRFKVQIPDVSILHNIQNGYGTDSAPFPIDTGAPSQEVKRQEREANRGKQSWRITALPHKFS
jgi:hypothetical protein